MFEWITDTVDAVVDFVTGGNRRRPPPDPCDVGNCLAAKRDLAAARRRVRAACNWLIFTMLPIRAAAAVLSQSIAVYIAALIVLFLIFGLLAPVIAAGIALVAILTIKAFAPAVQAAALRLGEEARSEMDAIIAVARDCSSECQGDLAPSQCDAGDGNVLPETPIDRFLGLDRLRNSLRP